MKKKKKILIVDDDKRFRSLYEIYFEFEDCDLYFAENGKQGLEVLHKTIPDIILLDLMMPVMDGYQMLEILKNNPDFSSIPVLVITVNTSAEEIVRTMRIGADDYLKKPFDFRELVARTKKLLELKRTQETMRKEAMFLRQYQTFLENEVNKWAGKAANFKKQLTNA